MKTNIFSFNLNYTVFAWEARKRGTDVHVLAEPTKMALLTKHFEEKKDAYKKGVFVFICVALFVSLCVALFVSLFYFVFAFNCLFLWYFAYFIYSLLLISHHFVFSFLRLTCASYIIFVYYSILFFDLV